MAELDSKLALLLHLRRRLQNLSGRPDSATALAQIDAQIDQLAQSLPDLALDELVRRCSDQAIAIPQLLRDLHVEEQASSLLTRRHSALAAGLDDLDLSDIDPLLGRIPLNPFSWRSATTALSALHAAIGQPHGEFGTLRDITAKLFESPGLPAGFPEANFTISQRLLGSRNAILRGLIFADCENLPLLLHQAGLNHWDGLGQALAQRELPGDTGSFQLIRNELKRGSGFRRELRAAVLSWRGPNASGLLGQLYATAKNDGPLARLIELRTGIHPGADPQGWQLWLQAEQRREQAEYAAFIRAVDDQRLVYELALAFHVLPQTRLLEIWWPAWHAHQASAQVAQSAMTANAPLERMVASAPGAAPADTAREAAQEAEEQRQELLETLSAEPDEELVELAAPTKRLTFEDQVIESHSGWNTYARPFLQENVLALVSGAFLVTALTFFAWYSWDKGPLGRTIASLLLTLGASTGTAYVCNFIGRVRAEATPTQAESLFASLCVLSIPFNLLLGASLLRENFVWSLAVGAVNLAVIPWIARWIERPFGHRPVLYLFLANAALYLPASVARLGLDPSLTKDVLPFVSFGLLFTFLRIAEARAPQRAHFNRLLLAGHFLLAISVAYVFVGAKPSFEAVALFTAWAGLGLSHLSGGRRLGAALAAGFSLNGLLLLLNQPPLWLPAVLMALLTWRKLAADLKEHAWPREVLAVHQILLVVALIRLFSNDLLAYEIALLVGILWLFIQELRDAKQPLITVSAGLALGLILPIGTLLLLAPNPSVALLGAGFAAIAHLRTARVPSRSLWFLYHGLAAALAILALWLLAQISLALACAITACTWALLSQLLNDWITRQHRTVLLWGLTAATMLAIAFELPAAASVIAIAPTFLCLASTLVCAHRARSALPLYCALGLIGLVVSSLQTHYSGWVAIAMAALALSLSFLLRRQQALADTESAEACFAQPFPLCLPHYPQGPLLLATVLAIAFALVAAALAYEPRSLNGEAFVPLGCAALLFALAKRLDQQLPVHLAIHAKTLFWGALIAWLPADLQAQAVALLTIAAILAHGFLARASEGSIRQTVALSLRYWLFGLIAAGPLLAYLAMGQGSLLELAVFLPFIVCSHAFLDRVIPETHIRELAATYVLITLAVTLACAQATWLGNQQLAAALALTALELALLVFACELLRHPKYLAFDAFGQGLASALALAASILVCFSDDVSSRFAVLAVAWFCLQLFTRRYVLSPAHLIKCLVLIAVFFHGPADALPATAAGLCCWVGLELLTLLASKRLFSRLRPHDPVRYRKHFDDTLLVGAVLLLGVHLIVTLQQSLLMPQPHYLLYLLVPMAAWLGRREARWTLWAPLALAYANGFWIMWSLPLLRAMQLNGLHALSLALVATIAIVHYAVRGKRIADANLQARLETVCTGLAMLAILLTTLSFVLAPRLLAHFETRFLFNATLMLVLAAYLRFALTGINDLQRALYRIALTGCLWSLGLFLLPYPQLIPWLIALPGFYFLARTEVKGGARPTVEPIAAITLLLLAVFVYLQHQPINLILFPEQPFDGHGYLLNAPLPLVVGFAILRMHRHVDWKGLAYLGTVIALAGLTLTGIWLSLPLNLPHASLVWTLAVTHLFLAAIYHAPEIRDGLIAFSGLRAEELQPYRWLIYGTANTVLLVCLVLLAFQLEGQAWWGLALIACLLGLLYDLRASTVQMVLIAVGLLALPLGPLLLPVLPADFWVGMLALLLALAVGLRRQPRLAHLIHNHCFGLLAALYLLACLHAHSLNPLGLARFALLAVAWLALPDKPHLIPQSHQPKLWTPLVALVLLCLGRGYSVTFLPHLALANLLVPCLLALALNHAGLQHYAAARRWHFLSAWTATARESLVFLLLLSYGACFAALACYTDLVMDAADFVWPIIVTFACGYVTLMVWATRSRSAALIFCADVSLWLAVLIVRWRISELEGFATLGRWDAYAVLALSVLSLGAREMLKERLPELAHYLYFSTQVYAVLGWVLMLVLRYAFGLEGHAEIGSGLVAVLFLLLARHQHKRNLVYGFLFANAAVALYFQSLSWNEVQIYTTPILVSVMALAQIFKDELGERRLAYVRLYAGLALLASSCWFNLIDFDQSVWYPLIAAVVAALVVVVGIALRIRIYLFLGSGFLLTNLIGTLAHVIVRQPPTQVKLLLGVVSLVVGLIFLGSFLVFQAKRKEILDRYAQLVETLKAWE